MHLRLVNFVGKSEKITRATMFADGKKIAEFLGQVPSGALRAAMQEFGERFPAERQALVKHLMGEAKVEEQ